MCHETKSVWYGSSDTGILLGCVLSITQIMDWAARWSNFEMMVFYLDVFSILQNFEIKKYRSIFENFS